MAGFLRRKPRFVDAELRGLSEMLSFCPPDPTPGVELLDPQRLDYSLESLAHVDEYLDALRGRELSDRDLIVVALRCGGYVGEVLRRHARSRDYHWLDYDDAKAIRSFRDVVGSKSLSVQAVLWDGAEGFAFPLAKVLKFLKNGPEDSTRYFVTVWLAAEKQAGASA